MIRITVELISANGAERDRVLGVAEIANEGTGTREVANYRVSLSKWAPKQGETWKRGEVRGFPRLRLGVWDLLYCALREIVGGRNP